MAVSSGSFNTSANGNWYATFNWSIASTDESAGTTTINYNVTAHNAAGKYRTVYQKDLYINGSQVFYRAGTSGNGQSCYEGTVITSGSFTFSGTGLSASFACGVGSYPGTNVSGSGSWSVPEVSPRYWNDVNVLNPAGTQDYASGYFDLYTSENNSWRYNLTNEDSDMTHKKGTYFQVQNIRPYYDYYTLNYVDGHDSVPATGAYRKTFDAANEVMSIYMKYKNFTLTINPNGGSYNGSTSNTTVTQAFNTTYTMKYPTRTNYIFSHWSASRGSNFNEYGLNTTVYNNNGNGTVTHQWLQSESTSGTNADVLKIVTNGSASPYAGGFFQAFQTAANHTYYQIYRAKIPSGYTMCYHNNAMGDNPKVTALTNMAGTGDWKTYIFKLVTTGTGTFSSSGFISVNGSNNTSVTWYVASAQVWDATDGVYRANSNGIYRYDFAASNCTLTANWQQVNWYLDVNWTKDGSSMSNALDSGCATADVYINDSRVAASVGDYYTAHPYGSKYSVTATTRTGYHFTDNTTSQTKSGTIGEANVGLTFAVATNTYTVKYDANGGEGTTASSSHTYGVAKNLTSNGFTRIGYNFLGWSTSSTATTATYTDGQSVSNLTATHGATVTLYAVWAMRAPYNVYTDFYTYRDKITVEVLYTGITSNNVIYYKAASASSYSTKDIGTATTYTLTGLQPNTEYYIYIKMTNGGGTTTTGTEIVETKAYVPASPTLTATDTGLTDVTFLMSATAETNAPTTSYTIYQTYKISKNTYDMALCHLSDGSVWARIFYHNTKQGTVLFSSLAEIKSTQTVDKYSRLGQLSEFKRSNGTYEFMLRYPNYSSTLYNRWTQTSNPMEEFITTTSDGAGKATGYTAVHIDWTGSYWGGLTRQNSDANSISSCYLSGSVGHTNWFYAIGATSTWGNGIPGAQSSIDTGTVWGVAELWVRIDDATVVTNGLGNTSNMTPTLTGLSNGTEYTFWLGVENAGGKNYSSRIDVTTSSPIAQLYTKVNGAWKNGDAYFKLNGEWVPVYHVYTKINGAWISKGSPPLVSFKIDGVSYQVRVGMTWSDWCNSSYNKDNYWVNTSGIVTWGSGRAFPTFEGRDVYGTEAVMANYEYGYYSTEK